jgi:spore coat polysaccharide biosynthesis predicted glycosyltransferase SpsG
MTVVIGSTNPHFDLIHATVKNYPSITLLKNVENMPELMAWADIAVSGGGSTCIELIYMGLPSCVIKMAENQLQNVNSLAKKQIIIPLGDSETLNQKQAGNIIFCLVQNRDNRQKMYELSKTELNGNGSLEIATHLLRNMKESEVQ